MKPIIASLTDVSENLRSEYEARDGAFHLKLDGELPELKDVKEKLSSFRDNNIRLIKEAEATSAKLKNLEGLDPVEFAALKMKVAEFEKTGTKGPADIETKIRQAVAAAVEPLQKQVLAETETRKAAEASLAQRDLETKLRAVGTKLKVLDSAVTDFLSRGLRTFKPDGLAYEGDKQMYSREKVTEPLSMEEWGRIQLIEAPHLFTPSQGGGARPGPGGAGKRTVSASDPVELGRHADAIAKGEIVVVP
jgi:hypothetical protein